MAPDKNSRNKNQMLTCRSCGEEFLVTSTAHTPVCPRCGRPVRTLAHRRLFRLLAVILLAAVVIIVLVTLYRGK